MAADIDGTGVKVRLVLPGAIDTEIWDQPGNDAPFYSGPLTPAEEVADGLVEAIDSPVFEHYLPDMKAVIEMEDRRLRRLPGRHARAVQKQPPGSYDATRVPDRESLR